MTSKEYRNKLEAQNALNRLRSVKESKDIHFIASLFHLVAEADGYSEQWGGINVQPNQFVAYLDDEIQTASKRELRGTGLAYSFFLDIFEPIIDLLIRSNKIAPINGYASSDYAYSKFKDLYVEFYYGQRQYIGQITSVNNEGEIEVKVKGHKRIYKGSVFDSFDIVDAPSE